MIFMSGGSWRASRRVPSALQHESVPRAQEAGRSNGREGVFFLLMSAQVFLSANNPQKKKKPAR